MLNNVTIIGSGTQGSMLAFRSAAYGRNVTIYDISEDQLAGAMTKIRGWMEDWTAKGKIEKDFADRAYEGIRTTTDLADALADCDIVIENVPEILELKQEVWAQIDELAPEKTLLTTNSSSLKSSDINIKCKRKDKTFNINFMTPTTDDLVEFMCNGDTTEETRDAALAFLRGNGHVPIVTNKEIKGFSLNRVWRAIKKECLKLWADGYISPSDFDRAWVLDWGTPYGPFGLMDMVGLDIVRQIEMTYYAESGDPADLPPKALDEMVEKGLLGVKSGRGFYTYPDPEYAKECWLRGE